MRGATHHDLFVQDKASGDQDQAAMPQVQHRQRMVLRLATLPDSLTCQ
jgi:hypothetical protein